MKKPFLAALALPLLFASCLENEETIQVRPDGSVHVKLVAKGDIVDLTDGYPLPLGGPWIPSGDAPMWLEHVGPDTGSAYVQERADQIDWMAKTNHNKDDGMSLVVEADFQSVESWPRFHAPDSEPYRNAYLERSASLKVEDKGDRLVYTFERVYHGRVKEGYDALGDLDLSDELEARFEQHAPLSADELEYVAGLLRAGAETVAERAARDSVLMVYTRGDAMLDPAVAARAVADVRTAVGAVFTEPYVDRLWNDSIAWDAAEKDEEVEAGPHPIERIDRDMRAAFRTSLADSLTSQGAPSETVHAALFGVEWNLTAQDHTTDLSDEKFDVRVAMPGTIVGGNYAALDENGLARWEFEGKDLNDRDHVMRVVSVLMK